MTRPRLTKDEYISKLLNTNRSLRANVRGLEQKVTNCTAISESYRADMLFYKDLYAKSAFETHELRVLKETIRSKGMDPEALLEEAYKFNHNYFSSLVDHARGFIEKLTRKDAA